MGLLAGLLTGRWPEQRVAMIRDAKAKVKRSQSVIVRIPNRAAAVVAVGGFTTSTVLSQAPTAAAPTGSPAGARARQTTAVPGPLGQVAVFAHQARIAAQHLGHTSRHHLKEVVVEVLVEGHVEKQDVVGTEESRPRACSALPLISVQPAAQESHRRRRPALQRC